MVQNPSPVYNTMAAHCYTFYTNTIGVLNYHNSDIYRTSLLLLRVS
jgi:hypothetical protein